MDEVEAALNEEDEDDDESEVVRVPPCGSFFEGPLPPPSEALMRSLRASWPREPIERLVLNTLALIAKLVDSEQEPPAAMMKLHAVADAESGWLAVVAAMIDAIPVHEPLGPAAITLLLDDCPLPTADTVRKLEVMLCLDHERKEGKTFRDRNVAIVLGCLAEKLAGPRSLDLFTPKILDYLIRNLDVDVNVDHTVILFSLVALEKFAQTSENKVTIRKRLERLDPHPLMKLEAFLGENVKEDEDCLRRQVGFCAQWCLDNLFVLEDGRRDFSYKGAKVDNVQVMLNANDVSEYLKIGPDGLEARCDAASFESVRTTFQVAESGKWYYEVRIFTSGIMQIGWATKDSKFLNHEGFGIGDDAHSVAFDGCRQLLWYNAFSRSIASESPRWRAGDVVGAFLDLDAGRVIFSLNGKRISTFKQVFETTSKRSGFFAAASFMSFQQCRFNFGAEPFLFPPPEPFQSFNAFGSLTADEKTILPRHLKLELLKRESVKEDACTLCFGRPADSSISPCGHRGFCGECCGQLESCPMCRGRIEAVDKITDSDIVVDLN